jgi:hypothetical protein
MWLCVNPGLTGVSEKPIASIFRVVVAVSFPNAMDTECVADNG